MPRYERFRKAFISRMSGRILGTYRTAKRIYSQGLSAIFF